MPLKDDNWIVCGNALRLKVCPPEGTGVKLVEDDLFQTPLEQPVIDFENEGRETFICGNPPYKGSSKQSTEQEADLQQFVGFGVQKWGILDYVCGWSASRRMLGWAEDWKIGLVHIQPGRPMQNGHVERTENLHL